jgi:hypothetical protein
MVQSRALNHGRHGHFGISRHYHKLKILPASLGPMSIKRQKKNCQSLILNIQNFYFNRVKIIWLIETDVSEARLATQLELQKVDKILTRQDTELIRG